MYEQHFGFSRPPFRITPDPEFFFPGGNRGAVLEALVYAVVRGEGIVKVVGEVGSGKTMLCRMLEREMPAQCEIVYLANPRLSAAEILHAIAFELALDVAPGDSKLKVVHALHEYLLKRHAENRRVIMFVEEAQGMPLESLEEIRMLSNLETTRDKLLQIVLFGQPELDEKLAGHAIRQLRERITHSFELAPFRREEVREYVNARVRASGYRGGELFTAAAVVELQRYSEGLLRRINVLADKALLAAFAGHESVVEPRHVRRAAADCDFSRGRPRFSPLWSWAAAAVVVVAGVVVWMLSDRQEKLLLSAPALSQAAPAADAAATLTRVPRGTVELRAVDTVSAAAATAQAELPDNPIRVPRISAQSGLVSSEHLGPRLDTLAGGFGNE